MCQCNSNFWIFQELSIDKLKIICIDIYFFTSECFRIAFSLFMLISFRIRSIALSHIHVLGLSIFGRSGFKVNCSLNCECIWCKFICLQKGASWRAWCNPSEGCIWIDIHFSSKMVSRSYPLCLVWINFPFRFSICCSFKASLHTECAFSLVFLSFYLFSIFGLLLFWRLNLLAWILYCFCCESRCVGFQSIMFLYLFLDHFSLTSYT